MENDGKYFIHIKQYMLMSDIYTCNTIQYIYQNIYVHINKVSSICHTHIHSSNYKYIYQCSKHGSWVLSNSINEVVLTCVYNICFLAKIRKKNHVKSYIFTSVNIAV